MTTPSFASLGSHGCAIDVGSEHCMSRLPWPAQQSLVQPPANCMIAGLSAGARVRSWRWKPPAFTALPYEVLEKRACRWWWSWKSNVKELPGRKTDMKDCHPAGDAARARIAQAGFVPPSTSPPAGLYPLAHRSHHDGGQSRTAQQKALDRMNLKIPTYQRSDRSQWSENDARRFWRASESRSRCCAVRCADSENKAGPIARALEGTWKEETLCPAPSLRAVAVLPEEDRRV